MNFSSSSEESRQSIDKLERTLDHILRTDIGLSKRITDAQACATQSHYAASANQSLTNISDNASISTARSNVLPQIDVSSKIQEKPAFGLDSKVEHDLFSSFVYLRARGRHSLSSLPSTSGAGSKQRWSCFSQLSLAEVSNLSVLSLPISCQELWSPQQYLSRRNSEMPSGHHHVGNSAGRRSSVPLQISTQVRSKNGGKNNPQSALNTLGTKVLGGKYSALLNEAEARRISAAIDRDIGWAMFRNLVSKILLLGEALLPLLGALFRRCAKFPR